LKVWSAKYSQATIGKYVRCMTCNKLGHFKCTLEKSSLKMSLDFSMKESLEDFSDREIS